MGKRYIVNDRDFLTPKDNEPRRAFRCDNCSEWVYVGDWYYRLSDDIQLCEYCLHDTLEKYGSEITSDDIEYTDEY